jgi:hypothetical protein
MASRRFYGRVGYGASMESVPGVWEDVITEVHYYGDIIRNSRQLHDDQKVNNDLTVGNSISIIVDAYAVENFFDMRYVEWNGVLWTISNVEVQGPRLLLTLGGSYNGPTP